MQLLTTPFIPKSIVLKRTRFSMFPSGRLKLNLQCEYDVLLDAINIIANQCVSYFQVEMGIDDVAENMKHTKLAVQLGLFNVLAVADEEAMERFAVITEDTLGSQSMLRFMHMILRLQMRIPLEIQEALAGRFYYALTETLGICTKQDAFRIHVTYPWFWILPIYQQEIERLALPITQRGTS